MSGSGVASGDAVDCGSLVATTVFVLVVVSVVTLVVVSVAGTGVELTTVVCSLVFAATL